ncbi:orotidine-5'-phosphate decarboxylase [Melioribacteraceae bacterium 4301-Me]|uniref:orotidine-5'-phosphate decarboxylase n=1 Tax=Pyranulibacter aquaticus TaxID=3163344 RepID=UPI00359A18C3
MNALQKLNNKLKNNLFICVGLDTDIKRIPSHLLNKSEPILEFNRIIIENTYNYASAYKINFAFYEKFGSKGFQYISQTKKMIPSDTLVIADAKRGDIGNTAKMYAQSIYDELNFDAVTLNPYMGYDSVQPFLEYTEKLNFILALTSNKSAADFEKLKLADGSFLYQQVINKIKEWNKKGNCGIVYGATNKDDLVNDILLFDDLPVLLPGIGAQGGNLEDVVRLFITNNKRNFIVNISRALIYLDDSSEFGDKINRYMTYLNEKILQITNEN